MIYDNITKRYYCNKTYDIVGAYTFKISAMDLCNNTNTTEGKFIIAAIPGAPTNLRTITGESFINLSWDAPESDGGFEIVNYMIYRGTTPDGEGFFAQIGDVSFYNDTNVTTGLTYFYKVRAKNSIGQGPLSNEINATPDATSIIPRIQLDQEERLPWLWIIITIIIVVTVTMLSIVIYLNKKRSGRNPPKEPQHLSEDEQYNFH